jgi:ATP phosphoribosyltransferase regulatory subunit
MGTDMKAGRRIELDAGVLDDELRIALELRQLYFENGFSRSKIGKFERYDLYREHKDFLVCENVISFSDTDGSLLALKPDVTLSIISGFDDSASKVQKVYYDEDVFRVSGWTGRFRCCRQVGLECFGKVGRSDFCQVLGLAMESLGKLDDGYVIALSDMNIALKGLALFCKSDAEIAEAVRLAKSKNHAELRRFLSNRAEGQDIRLEALMSLFGIVSVPDSGCLGELEKICVELNAAKEFDLFRRLLDDKRISSNADRIQIDFSLLGDMSYYSGLYFNGFVGNSGEAVLSGGEYEKLLKKMGKKGKAIGFAVYLDRLGNLKRSVREC